MKITITVPKNSTDDFYQSIVNGFKKKYGEDNSFVKEIDETIIGGFIAEANGTVFDTSIRSKLNEIKRVITE